MNNRGHGIGGASIILIFAVLCMTIFSLISLQTALAGQNLATAQEKYIKDYYNADTQAEHVLAEIINAVVVPDNIGGIDITTGYDEHLRAETYAFSCTVNDTKELYVKAAVKRDACDILVWTVQDTAFWIFDDSLPVWHGGLDIWGTD